MPWIDDCPAFKRHGYTHDRYSTIVSIDMNLCARAYYATLFFSTAHSNAVIRFLFPCAPTEVIRGRVKNGDHAFVLEIAQSKRKGIDIEFSRQVIHDTFTCKGVCCSGQAAIGTLSQR